MTQDLLINLRRRGFYVHGVLQWHSRRSARYLFSCLLERIHQLSRKGIKEEAGYVDILLADDDEDDRQLFEEAILRISPEIRVGCMVNGMQLIQRLESGPLPQMIFLDLNMPGKNGRECLAEIRSRAEWSSIPIVIYSTSTNKKDIRETYTCGASLYLMKPSSFRTLVDIIRKAFSIDLAGRRVAEEDFVLSNVK